MEKKIFYSWQSDLPNKVNRGFIEEALKKAIQNLDSDIDIQEALRDEMITFDKDTMNVPGIPPIVETIFQKISECTVFVPDLTFVGASKEGRLIPNPNVLIEYGWALKAIGYSKIIPIMNSFYGKPEINNMPFDMRHLRHPLVYHLDPSNFENKGNIQNELVKSFAEAIKLILLTTPNIENINFQQTPFTSSPSLFVKANETFDVDRRGVNNTINKIYFPNSQNLFLRIIPSKPLNIKSTKEALDLMVAGQIKPMNHTRTSGWSNERNIYGSFCYECNSETGEIRYITQFFKNGELWGIDSETVKKERLKLFYNTDFGFIPSELFEEIFRNTLYNYLSFSEKSLQLSLPIKFIAGITDIEGYKMAGDFGFFEKFAGRIDEVNVFYEGIIDNYYEDCNDILMPFFEKVWEECGLERPSKKK